MLQPKTVHYPSGFPMPQTPPVFVCSSPGPDPYESNGNLYEELDQPDSYSVISQHDSRSLPQTDRASDRLNSSADTASATDEVVTAPGDNNGRDDDVGDISSNSRIVFSAVESEVERRNRINAQLSNPSMDVSTIFRDRNVRFHPARASGNYYTPPHHMTIGRSSNGTNNCRFLTNPRAGHCWNNDNRNAVNLCSHYEPVFHESLAYNACPPSGAYQTYHAADCSSSRGGDNLRSPHHINQNAISPRRNVWTWFKNPRNP